MSITEYIQELNRLKRLAVDRWGSLNQMERDVLDGSFDWLIDNLDIKRGQIQVDEELSKIMDDFVRTVVETVNSAPTFQSTLKRFLQDLTTIQTNNKLFHSTTNNFNIETAGVTDVQKAVVGQIIDQYTANGLNAHFATPLKDNIFRNILAGANMREVKQVLQTHILGGNDKSGKLGQYLDQTAMMAVDSYTGAINQQLVKEFTFTGYIISGSLIETSSKQCVYAVENADQEIGYLNFEEWEKILDMARNNPKAKLIEGTTIKTLPLNKLHWGCRHDFTPIIMAKDLKKTPKAKQEAKNEPAKPTVRQEPKPVNSPKTPYKEARTMKEAKQIAKDILEANTGLKIAKVSGSAEDTVERMNKINKILDELTSQYQLSPAWRKEKTVKLSFNSSRHYGFVKSSAYADELIEVNFGHRVDDSRSVVVDPKIAYLRNKSFVDADNQAVSTTVHEFTHTMTIQGQTSRMAREEKFKDFWPEVIKLRKEYHAEISSLEWNEEDFSKIFLGRYASTNANEFLAEGFTEYKLSSSPSKYAKKIGLLIDKYFKK